MTPTQLESLRVAIAEKRGFTLTERRTFKGLPIWEKDGKSYAIRFAPRDGNYPNEFDWLPNYPTDPAAALDVIAALKAEGWAVSIDGYTNGNWLCDFWRDDTRENRNDEAPSFALAVALAAAKVWGIKI